MKLFKNGAELRLTQGDLEALLEEVMNSKFFILSSGMQKIVSLSLHPGNKYVVRVTFEAKNPTDRT
jgi:hypothetical protein